MGKKEIIKRILHAHTHTTQVHVKRDWEWKRDKYWGEREGERDCQRDRGTEKEKREEERKKVWDVCWNFNASLQSINHVEMNTKPSEIKKAIWVWINKNGQIYEKERIIYFLLF